MLVDLLAPEFYVITEDTNYENSKCRENSLCTSFGSYNISESSSNSTKEIPSKHKWSSSPDTIRTDIITIGGTQVKDVGLSLIKVTYESC
jgi:hypothetical protein